MIILRMCDDDILHIIHPATEEITQSPVRRVHIHRSRPMAQVTINDQHLLALDSETHRYVERQERLATARVERRDDNHVLRPVLARHELKVSAEDTERLVDDVTATILHQHHLASLTALLFTEQRLTMVLVLRNLTYERYS